MLKPSTKIMSLFSKKLTKVVIAIAVVAIAATAALQNKTIKAKLFGSKEAVVQRTTKVKKGNVKVTVAGSGSISFTNSYKVYSKINATIKKANFKEGDKVKAGDVIYELDDTDAQSSLSNNQNNLLQNQISAESSASDIKKLTITAPFAGQISNVTVNAGDKVQNGGTVLTIADTSKLKANLSFNSTEAGQIYVGQPVTINIASLMESVNGTVTYISNSTTTTTSGGKLYTVEIQMNNPGAVLEGMTVSAEIQTSKGTITSTNTAALSYINKKTVISETGGYVQSISAKENQKVNAGDTLVVMQNDDVLRNKQTADLKVAGSQSQISSSMRQMENYKIVAPADGIITKMSNKVGDTCKAGDEVADVSDPTQMEFQIPVDELDVAKLAVGQKVDITIDALTDTTSKPVSGEVSKIAVQGTAVSGVTTFPVTIKINDNLDRIKGGMNANGTIEVSNLSNVLYIPIEAITKVNGKSYVWVKGNGMGSSEMPAGETGQSTSSGSSSKNNNKNNNSGGDMGPDMGPGGAGTSSSSGKSATVSTKISGESGNRNTGFNGTRQSSGSSSNKSQNYYAGAVRKEVEVGTNDDSNIEIKSGLNEGDIVILPQIKTSSSTQSTQKSSGISGFGGGGAIGGGGRP